MAVNSLFLLCGLGLLAVCVLALIGVLVYHFTQKDRRDN